MLTRETTGCPALMVCILGPCMPMAHGPGRVTTSGLPLGWVGPGLSFDWAGPGLGSMAGNLSGHVYSLGRAGPGLLVTFLGRAWAQLSGPCRALGIRACRDKQRSAQYLMVRMAFYTPELPYCPHSIYVRDRLKIWCGITHNLIWLLFRSLFSPKLPWYSHSRGPRLQEGLPTALRQLRLRACRPTSRTCPRRHVRSSLPSHRPRPAIHVMSRAQSRFRACHHSVLPDTFQTMPFRLSPNPVCFVRSLDSIFWRSAFFLSHSSEWLPLRDLCSRNRHPDQLHASH